MVQNGYDSNEGCSTFQPSLIDDKKVENEEKKEGQPAAMKVIEILQEQLRAQKEEMQEKNKIIEELNKRLEESNKMLDQQQKLSAMDKQKILSLEEQYQNATKTKKGFFKKLFR